MAMGSTYAQGRRGDACAHLWGQPGFGLCNAYCEAKDCDSDNPKGSETSCEQLSTNFQELTGAPMPCSELFSPGSQLGICPCNFDVQSWTTTYNQILLSTGRPIAQRDFRRLYHLSTQPQRARGIIHIPEYNAEQLG